VRQRLDGVLPDEVAHELAAGAADERDEVAVETVADRVCELWGHGLRWRAEGGDGPPETAVLRLDSGKARERLRWAPAWGLEDALRATVDWYRAVADGADARAVCSAQIADYEAAARADGPRRAAR
jgi:CDP-glucose 4,6-dehydratase